MVMGWWIVINYNWSDLNEKNVEFTFNIYFNV